MLVDDVTIEVKAGDGGDGAVAFNRNKMELGPVGGAGGNGGSVWCIGTPDIGALARWRNTKEAAAADGADGEGQYRDGNDGPDLEFTVPVGTVIHFVDSGTSQEVTAAGHRVLLAQGGIGGHGNYHFRSSTDTSPRRFEHGTPGERRSVRLELKLIADVGLIGLPNAGKSTLLNECTRARQKIGDYPFTTLEPALGMYYGLVIADIPGLIEGASAGRGLGTKFLRHIERTRTLLHLVASDSADPFADWRVVRGELAAHNPALMAKEEIVLLTKTDEVDPAHVRQQVQAFADAGVRAIPVSVHDPDAMERVHTELRRLLGLKRTG
jgi:GTP-binding protein